MRIGIRPTISALVLGSILVSAVGVHALWWRTASENSRLLASTIDRQIVSTVEKEIAAIDTEARSAHAAISRSGSPAMRCWSSFDKLLALLAAFVIVEVGQYRFFHSLRRL